MLLVPLFPVRPDFLTSSLPAATQYRAGGYTVGKAANKANSGVCLTQLSSVPPHGRAVLCIVFGKIDQNTIPDGRRQVLEGVSLSCQSKASGIVCLAQPPCGTPPRLSTRTLLLAGERPRHPGPVAWHPPVRAEQLHGGCGPGHGLRLHHGGTVWLGIRAGSAQGGRLLRAVRRHRASPHP
jgi:hypothetical protein